MNPWRLRRNRAVGLVLAAVLLGAAGCSSGSDAASDGATTTAASVACPSPAAAPGADVDRVVTTAEGARTYRLWTPAGYDGSRALPLILLFHGTSGSPDAIASFTGLPVAGPARGYVVAAPQGLTGPDGATARWTIPGFGTQPDDVAFTAALIDDVSRTYCVDPDRVYATGFSSGGAFTQLLSCRMPERFAALAPLAGANLVRDCPSAASVPWISFHGDDDPFVSFHGNPTNPSDPNAVYFGDIEKTTDGVAVRNGCAPGRVDTAVVTDVVRRTYAGCRADTVLIVQHGAGHTFPGSAVSQAAAASRGKTIMEFDGAGALLDFFDTHARGSSTAR